MKISRTKKNSTNKINTSLNILYEDNHIIAVNKSNNDLTQKDITGDLSLVEKTKDYIKNKIIDCKFASKSNRFSNEKSRIRGNCRACKRK